MLMKRMAIFRRSWRVPRTYIASGFMYNVLELSRSSTNLIRQALVQIHLGAIVFLCLYFFLIL